MADECDMIFSFLLAIYELIRRGQAFGSVHIFSDRL